MFEKLARVLRRSIDTRYLSAQNTASTLHKIYQNSSGIVSEIERRTSFLAIIRRLSDAHFNLPQYYRKALENNERRPSILSEEDRKIIDEMLLSAIGEAKWVRNSIDKPSQQLNRVFKDSVLMPFSDTVLSAQSYLGSQHVIRYTPELIRKELRFSLRRLSASNVLLPTQTRMALANSHCMRIANEANKILSVNIENFLSDNGIPTEWEVDNILLMIPAVDMNKSMDELLLSELQLEMLREKLYPMGNREKVDEILQIYDEIIKDVQWKMKLLHDEIALVQEIEEEFGANKLYSQYVKTRLLYSAEWISRVMVLDVFSLPLVSMINNHLLENSNEVAHYSTNIFIKQVMTTMMGNLFNLSQKYRGNRASGYLVGVDTELHDYPKFLLRISCLAILLYVQANLGTEAGVDSETLLSFEMQKELVKSLARIISGSHVAFRMELKEKIIMPFLEFLNSIEAKDMVDGIFDLLALIEHEDDLNRISGLLESLDYLEKNCDLENILSIAKTMTVDDINLEENEHYQKILRLIDNLNNLGASELLQKIFDLDISEEVYKGISKFVVLLRGLNKDETEKSFSNIVEIVKEDRENQRERDFFPGTFVEEMGGEKLLHNEQDKNVGGPKLE